MNADELAYLSAAEQARLIAKRDISPVDLTRVYLERIERWEPTLHAHIIVCGDRALASARAAEKEIMDGRYRGPLHGLLYGVKDQIWVRGLRTTLGSRLLADASPDEDDATVVRRLDAAGAILIGKHNLHEFGKGGTRNFFFGEPRNPWNFECTPSSSSSGSGIAAAAGLCSGALGEDTGGSIRGPASACGAVGLRPTYGRVSRYGGMMYSWNSDTIGPLTRTVEDCALFLQAIAGHDPNDPLSSSRPVPDYSNSLGQGLKGLRLALAWKMIPKDVLDHDVYDATVEAARVFRSLGATVEEISLPLADLAVPLQMMTSDADVAAVMMPKWLRTHWNQIDADTRVRLAAASLIPAAVYSRAMRARVIVRRRVLEVLRNFDAIITPTDIAPAARIEDVRKTVASAENPVQKETLKRMTAYPFSVANAPALAIPSGFSHSGLPLSLQIAALPFAEDMIFRVAHAFEEATSWHTHHPNLDTVSAAFGEKVDAALD